MSIIGWVVLGGIAGWLASLITGRNQGMGCFANIAAGIVGAFIGGFVFSLFGSGGVTGFNFTSLIVATVGAIVLLFVIGLIRR